MDTSVEFAQKQNIITYGPAIPLLSVYPKKFKTLIWKDTCTTMLISLFTILAKIWKQIKYLSGINILKRCSTHTYNGILFSYNKKNEILPLAATGTEFEGMLNDMSDRER